MAAVIRGSADVGAPHRSREYGQRRGRAEGEARPHHRLWHREPTIDRNFHALAPTHPQWRDLPAVKAGRLHLAPTLPFGWIDSPPSINRLIGLRWLAGLLYPDAFPEDLRPIVRDFYTRCYHQSPTDEQLDQLLRQPAQAA